MKAKDDLVLEYLDEDQSKENETDLLDGDLDLSSALLHPTDWTTETIITQIEKGKVLLNPKFQRRDAWDLNRKSRFIESVILKFPIPQIVLAESRVDKGVFIVIDGLQRLLSLIQFAGSAALKAKYGSLKLQGLQILHVLNGKTYEDAKQDGSLSQYAGAFDDTTIRTVVIRNWKNDNTLYHIFLRLNQNSLGLAPQELRNALLPGPFIDLVDEHSANSPGLRKVLKNDSPDFRMRDSELLIRYFGLVNFLTDYRGSMKGFLDGTTEKLNTTFDQSASDIREMLSEFEATIAFVYEKFGLNAFRKFKSGKYEGRFNRAVFDVMLYALRDPKVRSAIDVKEVDLGEEWKNLSTSDLEFVSSLETTTKSLTSVVTRLSKWAEVISARTGVAIPIPVLKGERIEL